MIPFLKTDRRLWIAVLFGAGLILVAVILFTSTPSAAKPAVVWTPSSVTQIIEPGGTDTISVSFTVSKNLTNVTVRVVPELEPFVHVTPSSFPAVAKGETKTVQLELSTEPADPLLGSFVRKGTIRLLSGSGSKTFARPLPVSLFGLPPDPGEPGEATLEGINSDGDDVRDDIQRFIALNHPDAPPTRAALTQYARALQGALVDVEDREASITRSREFQRAVECLLFIRPDDGSVVLDTLHTEILNTNQRDEAYVTWSLQLSGEVFTLFDNPKEACAFDPDTLEN